VGAVQLDRATDDIVWEFARTNRYCIVTQDADFAERSRLYGSPPKVVWLRCGNCTPDHVEHMLRQNASVIREMIGNSSLDFIELF
jgi:predicted nuclease of predicted toxin-antitoxin system